MPVTLAGRAWRITLSNFVEFSASADLYDRYREAGQFEWLVSGEEISLVAHFDTEKDRSNIQLRDRGGFPTVTARTVRVSDDGVLSKQGVTFLVGPMMKEIPGVNTDVIVYAEDEINEASAY